MKTLSEHNKQIMDRVRAVKEGKTVPNGLRCDQCGTELHDSEPGMRYLTNPAFRKVVCPYCGFEGKRYE